MCVCACVCARACVSLCLVDTHLSVIDLRIVGVARGNGHHRGRVGRAVAAFEWPGWPGIHPRVSPSCQREGASDAAILNEHGLGLGLVILNEHGLELGVFQYNTDVCIIYGFHLFYLSRWS